MGRGSQLPSTPHDGPADRCKWLAFPWKMEEDDFDVDKWWSIIPKFPWNFSSMPQSTRARSWYRTWPFGNHYHWQSYYICHWMSLFLVCGMSLPWGLWLIIQHLCLSHEVYGKHWKINVSPMRSMAREMISLDHRWSLWKRFCHKKENFSSDVKK